MQDNYPSRWERHPSMIPARDSEDEEGRNLVDCLVDLGERMWETGNHVYNRGGNVKVISIPNDTWMGIDADVEELPGSNRYEQPACFDDEDERGFIERAVENIVYAVVLVSFNIYDRFCELKEKMMRRQRR